jgi:hypothetical protein
MTPDHCRDCQHIKEVIIIQRTCRLNCVHREMSTEEILKRNSEVLERVMRTV